MAGRSCELAGRRKAEISPGWKRLWWHSYRLGVRWLLRDSLRLWDSGRTGFVRLLVPLDPWRYYEMGVVADQSFAGKCLDVSSPKLLPSLLHREGSGQWSCTDLFSAEVQGWRRVDPTLALVVQDATKLAFPADTFESIICISVLEHIPDGADSVAIGEMYRVLRPGGVLHLTTDVSVRPQRTYIRERIYGEASSTDEDGVFFKRDYAISQLETLLAGHDWILREREFAIQRNTEIEEKFYQRAPWSYIYGGLLRHRCPDNFVVSKSPEILPDEGHGVVYVQLQKSSSVGES